MYFHSRLRHLVTVNLSFPTIHISVTSLLFLHCRRPVYAASSADNARRPRPGVIKPVSKQYAPGVDTCTGPVVQFTTTVTYA